MPATARSALEGAGVPYTYVFHARESTSPPARSVVEPYSVNEYDGGVPVPVKAKAAPELLAGFTAPTPPIPELASILVPAPNAVGNPVVPLTVGNASVGSKADVIKLLPLLGTLKVADMLFAIVTGEGGMEYPVTLIVMFSVSVDEPLLLIVAFCNVI